jgi:hypothetical protein
VQHDFHELMRFDSTSGREPMQLGLRK